jgi:predicted nuclease of restriction endonuclease-like (RecB) superfamily
MNSSDVRKADLTRLAFYGEIMSSNIVPYASKLVTMIEQSRQKALKSVNAELIQLYWNVGEFLSIECAKSSWGDGFIDETAHYIKTNFPKIKGFDRRGLYRMKRFYETYHGNDFVTTVLSQISWSNHLAILANTKTDEEREFYIRLCIKEKNSARELQRQIDSAYFHRYMLSSKSLAPIPIGKQYTNNFPYATRNWSP